MNEIPRIVLSHWVKGEPINYICSVCGRVFLFPEDRNPKEGAAEVMAAFHEHVSAKHSVEGEAQ